MTNTEYYKHWINFWRIEKDFKSKRDMIRFLVYTRFDMYSSVLAGRRQDIQARWDARKLRRSLQDHVATCGDAKKRSM